MVLVCLGARLAVSAVHLVREVLQSVSAEGGGIPPTPSTPTPERTSQLVDVLDNLFCLSLGRRDSREGGRFSLKLEEGCLSEQEMGSGGKHGGCEGGFFKGGRVA